VIKYKCDLGITLINTNVRKLSGNESGLDINMTLINNKS
jgi:hypothetical protein